MQTESSFFRPRLTFFWALLLPCLCREPSSIPYRLPVGASPHRQDPPSTPDTEKPTG